jgi:hypothetical protein
MQAGLQFWNTSPSLEVMICHPNMTSLLHTFPGSVSVTKTIGCGTNQNSLFFITLMNVNISCKETEKVILFGNW